MAYEVRALRRYKARYNSANTDNPLRVAIIRDGEKVNWVGTEGDTATITTYPPGSTTAIESDTALTCTAGSSVMTVNIDTSADTTNYTARTGYRGDISVSIGSVDYVGHIVFDVAKYLLTIPLTADQLLDREPRLRGRDWAGDDDFSGIIEACRDEIQQRLEGIAYESGRILEEMAIDPNKLAVPFRLYVLEAIFRTIPDDWAERAADEYEGKFETAWGVWMTQFKPDTSQSGSESSGPIKRIYQRLRT